MWRADAGHTAVSEETLADQLHLQWILTFSERKRVWDDPLNHDLMSYDKVLEPIVLGDLLFVSLADKDKLSAFDIESGEERWSFYADGPLRFAPVGWRDKVYVCSDDGYLYCLGARDGGLQWKFRGAPSDRKALGNERVISTWPARGGPVIRDGVVYFAASIWPFMGTFIYALEAHSGDVVWVNDGTGADYIKQPHSAPSFAGVAPQGTLVALKDHLLVPGGRSVPAAFDRETGALVHFHLNDGGKANGGSFVAGLGERFYVHTRYRGVRAYETKSGKKTGFTLNEPVLTENLIYTAAAQPDLKTRLEAATKAAKDAEADWKKAAKKLDTALADKTRPLTEPQKAFDEATAAHEKAAHALEELAISLDKEDPFVKEAETTLSKAKKAMDEAKKKLESAKKKRRDPIDKKLIEEEAKQELRLCEKALAHHALAQEWATRGRDVRVVQAYDAKNALQWEFEADASGDLIKAGDHLYAAGPDEIVAVSLTENKVTWKHAIDGEVLRLLAANGKLFAVTLDGRILCYGADRQRDPRKPLLKVAADKAWPFSKSADNKLARQVLALADADEGYALAFGVDDGRMLEAFAEESSMHFVATDPDEATVNGLRRKYDYMDLYGERIVLQQGDPQQFQAPPYLFNLVMLGDATAARLHDPATIRLIYESVRPYGGALWFRQEARLRALITSLDLPGAEVMSGPQGSTFVFRQGPLPDAADWTHQYGNMANTVKSDDKLVKLPLGILWFGGSPNTDVLPRHGHGPSEQVIGGRTIIEGMNRLSARDVYTGRILWKRDFENLGTYGVYYDHTYTDDPLNPAYNQVHIPGANGRGTNYIATEEAIYVAIGSACHVLDAETGQDLKIIEMPQAKDAARAPAWAFIGVHDNLLLAGNDFAHFEARYQLNEKKKTDSSKETSGRHGRKRKRKTSEDSAKPKEVPSIEDLSASQGLIAFDRETDEVLWEVKAEFSFLHNGIVAGTDLIYLLDKFPKSVEEKLKRRGLAKPEDYRILAVDAKTGEKVWEHRGEIFGTWLAYSAKHHILLQAGAKGRDRLKDEVGEGLFTYEADTGKLIWKKPKLAYAGPCILHNDLILTAPDQYADSAGAYHLTTGEAYMITNPLTGKKEPWRITRAYGCNNPIAGEHLLTFRSGAAGYYDLDNMSGTGNFGGFKSGCTSNLIPANGVLNAPDYTRTCSCGYQNQTSLALVHMPDVELWTYNRYGVDADEHEAVSRVGINFGAPGDRRDGDGTLWLEHPSVGGSSPAVTVTVEAPAEAKIETFRRHSSQVHTQQSLSWVAASGIRNPKKITITPRMQFQAKSSKDKLEIRVNSSNDDAEEAADGSVDPASSDLELVEDEGTQLVGLRFEDLALFPGERIKEAYIQFSVDEPDPKLEKGEKAPETVLVIHIEDASDAPAFSGAPHDLSSRTRVQQPIEWKPKAWAKKDDHGGDQRTPNLAPLLQSVVDRSGWALGHAVVFLIDGQGKRVAHAYDKDPGKAPRLVIELESIQPRVRVAAREDDAEEHADGTVKLDSSDLELTHDSEKEGAQTIGIRFRDLQIPRGQRLAGAHLQFTTKSPSKEPTALEIRVEDTVDPPPYKSDSHFLTSRTTTSAVIAWQPEPWIGKDHARSAQRSPDLSALIQPLLNRDSWEPGHAVSFLISGTGQRMPHSFDGKKELAPKLMLRYADEASSESIAMDAAPRFTVRLHFFDPDHLPAGKRQFHVTLQGQRCLSDLDLAHARTDKESVRVAEFTNIPIPHHLDIEFEAEVGQEPPVLSGVELIREEPTASLR